MKRIVMLSLLCMLCLMVCAGADVTSDNAYEYTVLSDGTARLDAIHTQQTATLTLPETVDWWTVTAIDGALLMDLQASVREVVMPATVRSIYNAPESGLEQVLFFGKGVKKLTIQGEGSPFTVSEDGLVYMDKRLVGCLNASERTAAVIAEGTTGADLRLFALCEKLKTIELPASMRFINTFREPTLYAQYRPEALEEFIVAPGNPSYYTEQGVLYCADRVVACPARLPHENVKIKEGTKTISAYAFYDVDTIKAVELPDTVETIAQKAFNHCDSLTTINIPSITEEIGVGALGCCWNLRNLNISAANKVFKYVDGMLMQGDVLLYCIDTGSQKEKVVVPSSVRKIADYAFTNNPVFTQVELPRSLNSIGVMAFAYTKLTSVSIPGNVTMVGTQAFFSCADLTEVTFLRATSSSTLSISDEAFMFCKKLQNLVFQNGSNVIRIGSNAFNSCIQLKNVTLPDTLVQIEDHAFGYCTYLQNITVPEKVKSLNISVFAGTAPKVYLAADTELTDSTYTTRAIFIVKDGSAAMRSCQKLGVSYQLDGERKSTGTLENNSMMLRKDLQVIFCSDPKISELLNAGGKMVFRFDTKMKLGNVTEVERLNDALWGVEGKFTMTVTYTSPQGMTEENTYSCSIPRRHTFVSGETYSVVLASTGQISLDNGLIDYEISLGQNRITLSTHAWTMILQGE